MAWIAMLYIIGGVAFAVWQLQLGPATVLGRPIYYPRALPVVLLSILWLPVLAYCFIVGRRS